MSQLISKGTFGCVYRPKINCDGTTSKSNKMATKLQQYDETAEIEKKISNIITTIDNYKYFFSPIQSMCPISYKELNNKILKSCDRLNVKEELILMEMEFINGKTFIETLMVFNGKDGVKVLLDSYSHLLNAISLLLDKKVVHFDLKSDNIMYNKIRNIPIIIDFGLAIDISKLNPSNYHKSFYGYYPDYYLWPPEVHFLCYLVNRKYQPVTETILDLARVYVKNLPSLNFLSSSFKKKYETSIVTYLQQFLNMTKEESINKILKHYNTWDNFSLSIMYLNIIKIIFIKENKENTFLIDFAGLIIKNISANPEKRLSIERTEEKYKTLFLKSNLKNNDFNNFLDKFEKHKTEIIKESKEREKMLLNLQYSFARL